MSTCINAITSLIQSYTPVKTNNTTNVSVHEIIKSESGSRRYRGTTTLVTSFINTDRPCLFQGTFRNLHKLQPAAYS